MRASNKLVRWRWVVIVAVLATVAAACQGGGTATTAAPTDGTTATTAATGGGDTTTSAATSTATFSYQMGIFQDTTTDNFWAYYDPASTVWNAYVLAPTKPAVYTINYPGIELDSDLAASADVPYRR